MAMKRGKYKTRLPLGTQLLVRICGEEGDSLLAEVVRNTHVPVVEIIQPHPVYRGCRLKPSEYRIERKESA